MGPFPGPLGAFTLPDDGVDEQLARSVRRADHRAAGTVEEVEFFLGDPAPGLMYEDLGLLTADHDIGQDLVKLFNYFTGHSMYHDYRQLFIAPGNMRDRIVERI